VRHGITGKKLKAYVPKIVKETEEFFAALGDEGTIDLHEVLAKLTILTASGCLLGHEVRERMSGRIAKLYHDLEHGMNPITVIAPTLPIQKHRARDAARKEMVEIFTAVIRERRGKPKGKNEDFLQVLLDSQYKDGTKLADEEIAALLLVMLFAGHHTSSITSTWTGVNIIGDKEKYMERLLAEQKQALEETEGELNFESVGKMHMLGNCMKETLRMYPPIVIQLRKVKKELKFKEYTIPKGDIVATCPPVTMSLPSLYKNGDCFDPDRFDRDQEGKTKFSYIAFGGGRHSCLGERFAYMQVKIIWSVLLRGFDFEMASPKPPVDFSNIIAGPKGSCMVKFKRKKK